MNGGMERNAVNVMTKDIRKIFFTRKLIYKKKKLKLKIIIFFCLKKQRDGKPICRPRRCVAL